MAPTNVELVGWNTDAVGLFKSGFKLDSSTGTFKVPADGKYQINAGALFRLTAGTGDLLAPTSVSTAPHIKVHILRKSTLHEIAKAAGSLVVSSGGDDPSAGVIQANLSGVFKLKKGDKLDLTVDLDPALLSDATVTVNALDTRANYFSAQRLH